MHARGETRADEGWSRRPTITETRRHRGPHETWEAARTEWARLGIVFVDTFVDAAANTRAGFGKRGPS
jgi:hypothetical protein